MPENIGINDLNSSNIKKPEVDGIVGPKDNTSNIENALTPEQYEGAEKMFEYLEKEQTHLALEEKYKHDFSEEFFKSPEIQKRVQSVFFDAFEKKEFYRAENIAEEFNIPRFVVDDTVKNKILEALEKGYSPGIFNSISDSFSTRKIIDSPEVKDAAIKALKKELSHDSFSIDKAISVSQELGLRSKEFEDIAKAEILVRLAKGQYKNMHTIEERVIGRWGELVENVEYREIAMKGFILSLREGRAEDAFPLKNMFSFSMIGASAEVKEALKSGLIANLTNTVDGINKAVMTYDRFEIKHFWQEMILSSEIQSALKIAICGIDPKMFYWHASQLMEKFNLSEEMIKDENVQKAAINGIEKALLVRNDDSEPAWIKDRFGVSVEVLKEIAAKAITSLLKMERVDDAIYLVTRYHVYREYLQNEELQKHAKIAMMNLLRKMPEVALKVSEIKNVFDISEEVIRSQEIQKLVKAYVLKSASEAEMHNFENICRDFYFPLKNARTPEFKLAGESGMIQALTESNIQKIEYINEFFDISKEFVASETFQVSAELGIAQALIRNRGHLHEDLKRWFGISDELIQNAGKEAICDLVSETNILRLKTIAKETRVGHSFFLSEKFQQAALRGLEVCKWEEWLVIIPQLKEDYGFPEDLIIQSGIEKVLTLLEGRDLESNAMRIMAQANIENTDIKDYLVAKDDHRMLLAFASVFNDFGMDKRELSEMYDKELEKRISGDGEDIDPQVRDNFIFLQNLLGKEKTKRIFMTHRLFWLNTHDSLLFVEKIKTLKADEAQKITRIVLLPLLNKDTDLGKLNNLIGSFSVQKYILKNGSEEVPFKNFAEFSRETQMQINNIEVPANASENFKEAIMTLIAAPGVDVKFIRLLIDIDDEKNKYESNYDFAVKLKRIIEGLDDIDSRQTIKPFEMEIPFDPVHRLAYTAVGIHSLNTQTPKLVEAFGRAEGKNDLQKILELLRELDSRNRKKLEGQYEKKIADNPDKKNRYVAEMQKYLKNSMILKMGNAGSIEGINLENRDSYNLEFSEEVLGNLKALLKSAIDEDLVLKNTILDILVNFGVRGERIYDCIDLLPFEPILPIVQKLLSEVEEKASSEKERLVSSGMEEKEAKRTTKEAVYESFEASDFLDYFKNNELLFTELLVYFGFNNQKRQAESKGFKNAIDKVLRQQKYQKIAKDPFIPYVQGELNIEPEDEESIKAILSQYGYGEIGRTLSLGIAKKSDPKAWVCGDYTDCCMQFTSDKNKEYLTREDMAYFTVSIKDADGGADMVAQSVLVEAEDRHGNKEIAIDNIEIANRAIKYRPMIVEAYKKLKDEMINRHKDEKFKLVIGTSYNDDGGMITSTCEMEDVDAKPKLGRMGYSDWADQSSNYVYFNSEKKEDVGQKYFGLQIDLFERSRAKRFIKDKEESDEVKKLLEKIGVGVDDGDGGLTFPDNYSVCIENDGEDLGYIVGADYITDDDISGAIYLEKMHLDDRFSDEEKEIILRKYISAKKIGSNDDIDSVVFQAEFIKNNEFVRRMIVELYKDSEIEDLEDGGVRVTF